MFKPIPLTDFLARTGIDVAHDMGHSWGPAQQIVSLRDIVSIDGIQVMSLSYLKKLLGKTRLMGGDTLAYAGCTIHSAVISPSVVRIGQRFIVRSKYQAILENFGSLFREYSIPGGIGHLGGLLVAGRLKDGTKVVAQYVPPIVEMNGTTTWTLLDGLHRNYLVERMGGTIAVVAIEGVQAPYPFSLHSWDKLQPTDAKPARQEDRYFDLKPPFFRDLKYVGIDG